MAERMNVCAIEFPPQVDEIREAGFTAVPAARVRVARDGDEILLGSRRLVAVATPGHARHHHA